MLVTGALAPRRMKWGVEVTDAVTRRNVSEVVSSREAKVEQWGLCVSCDRWFWCGTNAEHASQCRCPVCDRAPVAIRETLDA